MSKNIKKLLSIISMVLCITIGLSLPVEVYASTIPEKGEPVYSSFDDVQGETEEVGNILAELTDERTETSKEFLLDDGTKMIVDYGTPVHYQDNQDNWVEYNNSLKAENSTSTADEASAGEYTNKSSNIDVKFSNKVKANNMVKLASDDYSISWGYDDANKSKIKIVNNNEKLEGNEKFTTLKNLTSEAKYEDVYKNVDLQYFVTSTGVKENIILKSSDVQNEFNLTYKIKNLTAEQTDDYTITLFNKNNEEVYKIIAPYMTDADGKTSTQLKLEIVSQKGSNLNVKLTADYWFIHSLGRSFPITIDPELKEKLYSKLTFKEYVNESEHSYGPYYTSSDAYCNIKINNLPELNEGEKIVKAIIALDISNGSNLFSSSDNPVIVNLHNAQYNGTPRYEDQVQDYDAVTEDSCDNLQFDITSLINKWLEESASNDGFVLEAKDTIGSRNLVFASPTKAALNPVLTVVYKDYTGMESNLAYHTVSVGHNAQASVSDYLGNLVINQSIYEGTGSRMPVNISATYNSVLHNKLFENGSPAGYGWQFSFNQYVETADSTLQSAGYDYIYTDKDGTAHYFKKDNSTSSEQWTDEDDLGLTLTADENYVYISDGDVVQKYDSPSNKGVLLSETDSNNNVITYTYNSLGNLTKITDGSGREFKINYAYYSGNSEPRVKSIDLPDGNNINFAYYSNQLLACVEFPNNKSTWFYYTEYTSEGMLNKVEQRDYVDSAYVKGQKCGFTYSDSNQVTCVKEYGSDNSEGNYLNIAYGNDNTTVFTDRKGRSETHTFNNSGETISVLNANGYLINGASDGLTLSGGAESFTKNYVTESTEQTEIKSGNYFFKSNGSRNGTVSSGGTAVIDTSAPSEENGQVQYFGSTSIKVNNPVSETNSAFFTGAAHQFNTTEFNGKTMTFSAYVKTKDVNKIYSGGAVGAILKIKCFDSSGNRVNEVNSIGIDGTQDWQRLSVSADIPETTSYFRIYCLIRYASGTAWFDCLQLEEGNCANDFNALQNGDFSSNEYWLTNENSAINANNGTVTITGEAGAYPHEATLDNDADGEEETEPEVQPETTVQTVTETEPNGYVYTYDNYGNKVSSEQGMVNRIFKKTYVMGEMIDSTESVESTEPNQNADNAFGNKYIYQNIKVNRSGVAFKYTGTASVKSIPLSNTKRTCGIAFKIYYEGSNVPETYYQEFNTATSSQQCVNLSITPIYTTKIINHVAIAFVYGYNENEMKIANSELNIMALSHMENDDEAGTNSNIENSSNENNAVSENGYFCIDSELLSEEVDKSKPYIKKSSNYDEIGNYVASSINESGNITSYTYNINGYKTSVTDANGNTTNYTYNTDGMVTCVSKGNFQNTYTYNNINSLSKISHNDFDYQFNYDVYSNLITAKIGNQTILNNIYSQNNGELIKTIYANGCYIEYDYDIYGNISEIKSDSGVLAKYTYTKKGLIAKAEEPQTNQITYYYYNLNNELENKYAQSGSNELTYAVNYDDNGNKIQKTSIDGKVKTVTSGTDEYGDSFVSNDGITISSVTDSLGRVKEVITSRGENKSKYFTYYNYMDGQLENATTNTIKTITHKYETNQLVQYEYSYDANGNITEVKSNGEVILSYTYDDLDQLTYMRDYENYYYITYTYDDFGNISSNTFYSLSPYHPGLSATPENTTFSYENSNWGDLLTKINDDTITYDEMGNPLIYRDNMSMTWQNGRQLASVTKDGKTVTYTYNANGMRTQKNNDGDVTHYYYDSDNKLLGMKKGTYTLFFYYDSNGNASSMSINGSKYFFVKNLQGDVTELITEKGTVMGKYQYDAYGNIISITNSAGQEILNSNNAALLNPFRYRGYVYDEETGLYYLQSRYYDPKTGRFINADDIKYAYNTQNVLSANLFTYCNNNPIMYVDPTGYVFFAIPVITFEIADNIVSNSLAVQFYLVSIKNNEYYKLYDFSDENIFSLSSYLINCFKSSQGLNDALCYAISDIMIVQHELYRDKISVSFNTYNDNFDLYMAVGVCNAVLNIVKLNSYNGIRKYKINVTVTDRYNFDYISADEHGHLVSFINNVFGYNLQDGIILTPYCWFINFDVIFYYDAKNDRGVIE